MSVPVRTLLAGTTDSSGNASIQVNAPPTMYGVLTLIGKALGNPSWIVTAGGQLLMVGNGPLVVLGPTLTNPNELLTIAITNAVTNSQVTGTLAGNAHLTADEAAANYVPMANPVTVSTFSPTPLLGTVTAPGGGGQVSKVLPVPSGVSIIGLLIDFSLSGNPTQIRIDGTQTGNTYLSIANPASQGPGPFTAIIGSPVDTSVTVRVTPSGSTAVVDVIAYQGQVNVFAQQVSGTFYSVTQAGATPATWQAGTSTKLFDASINNSSTTVVAGVVGQSIKVHGWTNTFSAIGAATAILESDDANPGTVQYDIWNGVGTVGPFKGDAKGVACPVGAGLRIRNPFAVAMVVRGAVQYTQS